MAHYFLLMAVLIIALPTLALAVFKNKEQSPFGVVPPGDICVVPADCLGHPEKATCFITCRCQPKHIIIIQPGGAKSCEPIRNQIGEECIGDSQCPTGEGIACLPRYHDNTDKVCKCAENLVNEPGTNQCYERRDRVGQACVVNVQCQVNLGETSICHSERRTCQCEENIAYSNIEGTRCLPVINSLNKPCEESKQCTLGNPGPFSICQYSNITKISRCKCSEQAVNIRNSDVCLAKAKRIGDPCSDTMQCTPNLKENSICEREAEETSGTCNCTHGFISHPNRKECLPLASVIGDQCVNKVQCSRGVPGKHSKCSENKCACKDGSVIEPGFETCLPAAQRVNGRCEHNSQCEYNLGPLSRCVGRSSCKCIDLFSVEKSDGSFCLPILNALGEQCQENIQCQHGAPGPNSECSEPEGDSSSICRCNKDSVHRLGANVCYKAADKLGDNCTIPEQCHLRLGNVSTCISGQCGCNEETSIRTRENDKCLPIVDSLGGPCEINEQCRSVEGDNRFCNGTCQCEEDSVEDIYFNRCYVKATKVNDTCERDVQCSANLGPSAICKDGNCSCHFGTVPNLEGEPGTKCLSPLYSIGDPCTDMAECPGQPGISSECNHTLETPVCSCKLGYVVSTDLYECLKIIDYVGGFCREDIQCHLGAPGNRSSCITDPDIGYEDSCQCNEDSVADFEDNHCVLKAVEVGSPCERHIQCYSVLGSSLCNDLGLCECGFSHVPSSDNSKCLEKMSLGGECNEEVQCKHIENAICSNSSVGTCTCTDSFVQHPTVLDKCIPKTTLIGGPCEVQVQCDSINAICHNEETCQCKNLTQVVSSGNSSCLDVVTELHNPCEEKQQCKIVNSDCLLVTAQDKECVCIPHGYVEANQTLCLEIRHNIGDRCDDTIQCAAGISQRTECYEGQCKCQVGHEYFINDCYKPSALHNQSCNRNEECQLVNKFSICDEASQSCRCTKTTIEKDKSCWEVKLVGDKCQDTRECQASITGTVECVSGSCECSKGSSKGPIGLECKSGATFNNASILGLFCIAIMRKLVV